MTAGLTRSLLYVPGSSEAMIRKAGGRGADVLILDLEDGVHPDAKEEARERVARSLHEVDFSGAEVWVRANSLSTPWGPGDLARLARARPDGLVLPKVSDPAEVISTDENLARSVPLFLMVETVEGVLAASSLARSSPRVGGLIFGAADYRESLRAGKDPDEPELFFARSQILHAARSAGIEAFDTPWFEYTDGSGLERSARRARLLGFDGKTAIHPSQIPIINEVFSPSPAEIERARRILSAMEEAGKQGRNVASLDGELIEALHLKGARRVLDRAQKLGLLG